MRPVRVLVSTALVVLGPSGLLDVVSRPAGAAELGGLAECVSDSGDVNADGGVNVSDAITILGHLFLGSPVALVPLCEAPEGPGELPDTGQTTCYDDRGAIVDCASETCAGQDGRDETGCPPGNRFVDNGDGTVTDECTGLMWQRDVGNDGRGLDWCSGLVYCESLELAGHDDWRLPNARELTSILDYGHSDDAFDPVFGDVRASVRCWSSTTYAWSQLHDRAWFEPHGLLDSPTLPKTDRLAVRAVRSAIVDGGPPGGAECAGESGDVNADGGVDIADAVTILGHLFLGDPTTLAPPCVPMARSRGLPDTGQRVCYDGLGNAVNCASGDCAGQDGVYDTGCPSQGRFVDNLDGTVTDTCTGLMWEKDAGSSGRGLYWCSALDYCETLELAGHDDWRLPNARELESLVDYGRSRPAFPPVFRDNHDQHPFSNYWSSTTTSDAGAVFVLSARTGQLARLDKVTLRVVRAVRSLR